MKRILLICGGSGLLGSNFTNMLKGKFDEVHSTYLNKKYRDYDNIKYHKVDFNNKLEVSNLLKLTNPTLVINCIGLAEVDYCQKNSSNFTNNKLLLNQLNHISITIDNQNKWYKNLFKAIVWHGINTPKKFRKKE